MIFKRFITGFLMACADSVPGVSGGTIAYIMGLYDKFINSIHDLANKNKRVAAIKFLSIIAIGWVIGFIIAISIIASIINNHLYDLSSLFLGFILISIVITIRNEFTVLKQNTNNIYLTLIGIIFVVLIAYLGTIITPNTNESGNSFFTIIYLFITGFAAISCMLLPGISGSTMLLIFGVYYQITEAIHGLFKFDFSTLAIILPVGIGIISGAFFSVKILNYVFKNHYSKTIYFINGLLIGSIYAIIVGPISEQGEALSISNFNVGWFIIGMFIIITIDRLNKIIK